MFDTVLVANRGEIAVRILRTLRALGVRSIAVYSDADAGARHVREADVAYRIGPAAAEESYLHTERILAAAREARAQAVHPGYGFLSENPGFARACAEVGVVFVGPPPTAIEAMGDKIQAKQAVAAAGVPVVPGRSEPGLSDDDLMAAAEEIGFPVLLKPSAGGGGKGMRFVRAAGELAEEIVAARRESHAAFDDDTLLLERYIERPRHVEVQVLADQHGGVLHLGERECSLQRRHQKIVEEAPSPLLDEDRRATIGTSAVQAARACGYTGAGTVEYAIPSDHPEKFFFLEMNTRLQVEHPVTEMVTGLDLVEWQLRVASGEPLVFGQGQVRLDGHAVEARIYAEDPGQGFLPSSGRVLAIVEPELPDVRVDSGLATGDTIGTSYDPMLAKLVAWGATREAALRRLDQALGSTALLGMRTNVEFLRALLAHPEMRAGRLDTGLVKRHSDELIGTDLPEDVYAATALELLLSLQPAGPVVNPWDVPSGWRLGGRGWAVWHIQAGDRDPVEVRARGRADAAEVSIAGGTPVPAHASLVGTTLVAGYAGRSRRYTCARDGDLLWISRNGRTFALTKQNRLQARRRERAAPTSGAVRSPMPGTVLAVKTAKGEKVTAGQSLLIVEAMKMEHALTAPIDGVVAELHANLGQQTAVDETLAVVTSAEEE